MNIPPVSLPSDSSIKVHLRDATVDEMIEFSGVLPEFEEELKTKFLNTVQIPEHFSDSRVWSIYDRAYVLFWHWIHTRQHTTFNIPYDCKHCGERHNNFYEMKKLFEQSYCSLSGAKHREIHVGERKIKVRFLTGKDCEDLEKPYLELSSMEKQGLKSAPEYRIKKSRALVDELALICSFPASEVGLDDEQKIFEKRREIIAGLLSQDFSELVEKVREAERSMSHGIIGKRVGIKLFWAVSHQCSKEEGRSTTVLFPFRANSYVPRILAE